MKIDRIDKDMPEAHGHMICAREGGSRDRRYGRKICSRIPGMQRIGIDLARKAARALQQKIIRAGFAPATCSLQSESGSRGS